MAQCVVIADDLTGGNATGVLLTKMDYSVYTILNKDAVEPALIDGCDCVIYPTDSRGISPEEAYDRVYRATELLKKEDVKLYSHRIDSTLRGNLGAETDAVLDSLGKDYVAIVVPTFPATSRVVIGGYMLVDGIPLHKSGIAVDPKTPVKTSNVTEVLEKQTKYRVGTIRMDNMMNGKHHLAGVMNEMISAGCRILSLDAVTQEDLDLIADAVITSRQKAVIVDSGVMTATMARKLIKPFQTKGKSKILVVMGSVHPMAKVQMEELWLSQRTHNCFVETRKLLDEETREEEIRRVVADIQASSDRNQICTVTGDGIYPENRIDFEPYHRRFGMTLDELTGVINSGFAEIAYSIFSADPLFKGLYTGGGDITVSVCERFGTAGLKLLDEVLPLAAYGSFLKGEFEGLQIITKGGSQGKSDAINRCITYLKEKLYI